MDIRKVKADQLTLLACLSCTISLVSNSEVEASRMCVELFGNIYFIYFNSKLNGKNVWNSVEIVSSLGTGKQFYF